MLKYFLKRVSLDLVALILTGIIIYLMLVGVRGNPFNIGDFPSENSYNLALQEAGITYGYNEFTHQQEWVPIITRLWNYIVGLFHGDLGRVYVPQKMGGFSEVPGLVFAPLKYTIMVILPSAILSLLIGISFGIFSGYKHGTWVDSFFTSFAALMFGLPVFIIAAIGLIIGPSIGLPITFLDALADPSYSIGMMIQSLILPILILTISGFSLLTIFIRNEIVTILDSEYVQVARSKGMSEREVFTKYVARNGTIPIISQIVGIFIGLLGGSLVIETFFNIPGTSQILVDAITAGEINIVMFNTIFFAFIFVFANAFIEMSYVFIDPRITYSIATETKFIKNGKFWLKRSKNEHLETEVK